MTAPLIPPNEANRLADLYSYGVLDTAAEKIFDEMAELAAAICGTRYAAVTLIDRDRQWFKAEFGSSFGQSSRDDSVCGHAILERDLFEVPDTHNDPRFVGNMLLNDAKVRFYSGSQLNTSRGNSIGMLCVMDSEPRSLSASQKLSLAQLANVLMAVLEAGRQSRMLNWFGTLVDNATDEIQVLDSVSLRYLYANAKAVRSLGYTLEQLRDMTPVDGTPDSGRDKLMAYVRQLQAGAPQVVFESVRRRDNGELYPVEIRWQLLSSLGEPVILCLVHDITERQQMDRMKSEFIAVVSHELRTPLTSIHGAVKLLEKGVAGALPAPAAKLVSLAAQSTDRLRKIVDDIVDFEKISSGQMEFALEPLLASVALKNVAQEYEAVARAAGVQLEVQATPGLRMHADTQRLHQVLANLVSNAIKFAPGGSSVSLTAFAAAGSALSSVPFVPDVAGAPVAAVRLQVTDRGPGIPEHFRQRVFQSFAQADMQSSRQKEGSGLGLSIAKQIVENMHGSIGYNSQPGCTTFEVMLPEAGA